jgi:hypothetical protein
MSSTQCPLLNAQRPTPIVQHPLPNTHCQRYNNMQKRTPEIKAFIREHADLFWYIPDNKKEDISDETLVEFILNYGSMDDVLQLKNLLGTDYMSSLFLNLKGRKKLNYYPEIYNLFHLYFSKYAQGNSGQ